MRSRTLEWLVVVAAFLAVALALSAAPALKGGEPEIVGRFDWGSLHSPTVILEHNGERVVYWLVFTDHATENQANKLEDGNRVKVRGCLANGGAYRYVIVQSIARDE